MILTVPRISGHVNDGVKDRLAALDLPSPPRARLQGSPIARGRRARHWMLPATVTEYGAVPAATGEPMLVSAPVLASMV